MKWTKKWSFLNIYMKLTIDYVAEATAADIAAAARPPTRLHTCTVPSLHPVITPWPLLPKVARPFMLPCKNISMIRYYRRWCSCKQAVMKSPGLRPFGTAHTHFVFKSCAQFSAPLQYHQLTAHTCTQARDYFAEEREGSTTPYTSRVTQSRKRSRVLIIIRYCN